jgi:hypothetical protein
MRHLGRSIIPRTRIDSAGLAKRDRAEYVREVNREHGDVLRAIANGDPTPRAPRCAPTSSTAASGCARCAAKAATLDRLSPLPHPSNLYDVIQVDRHGPAALKSAISDGLLSFPLTDFTADLAFDAEGYRTRLEWLMPYGATALFAAAAPASSSRSRRASSAGHRGRVAHLQRQGSDHRGDGAGHALAIEFAREAEAAGASGLLLCPTT